MTKPPYTAIVRAGDWLIVSGQVGVLNGQLVGPSVAEQTIQALKNTRGLLRSEDSGLDDVVKTMCFLTDMTKFDEFNKAYASFFNEGVLPARSTVAVSALPFGAVVEIESWAYVPDRRTI